MESSRKYDITVVGGGIVGLATGFALTGRHPGRRIAVIEKESSWGFHQTGHSSGVIHSGVYYRPGSLKASLCVKGARALMAFCDEHRIPYQKCGKVIVATCPEELPRLEELHRRGRANGVANLSLISPERLRELEPHASGIRALHVPSTAIVDFRRVASALAQEIRTRGGSITLSAELRRIRRDGGAFLLETSQGEIQTRAWINCGGLQADRLTRMGGSSPALRIVPFRGEYYELVESRRRLVTGLIYPVPDPRFPFLGVHFTKRIDNNIEAGPNAVLSLKREGYRKTDWSLSDILEIIRFPGFWRMSARYWKTGLWELTRSISKPMFVKDLQRLVPEIRSEDLVPAEAGVRAQAVDPSGSLLDDFQLVESEGSLHVVNAPSPAATASLAIGEYLAQSAARHFGL
ncbi:MAG: L-2-hydroxyglutarate oxidase [Candidatus Omnitrophica bacterium]|nr:L-2-hydroxyglutarate oxidase [Candidatus Omnitrophota bacterium]